MSVPALIPSAMVPALNFTYVTDGAGLEKVRDYLSRVSIYTKDYETNITNRFVERRARCLQLGDRNEQYVIDFMAFAETKENLFASQGFFGRVEEQFKRFVKPVIEVIKPSFESNSHLKIGHNLEFEYVMSKWGFGLRPWNYYCTKTAEHIIYNGKVNIMATGFWGLEDLTRRYVGQEIDKTIQKTDWMHDGPLTEEELIYCALDCRLPFSIKNGQYKILQRDNLLEAVQIENDVIPAFGDLHMNGFFLSKDLWEQLREENVVELKETVAQLDEFFLPIVGRKERPDDERIATLEKAWRDLDDKSPREIELSDLIRTTRKNPELKAQYKAERDQLEEDRRLMKAEARLVYSELSKDRTQTNKNWEKWEGEARLNYNAPEQLYQAILKGSFGLHKNNLKGTSKKHLEKHPEKPVVKAIRKYRKLSKQIGTYGERWTRSVLDLDKENKGGYTDPTTGRIHANHNQMGAETGRASCTKPNLYNLPKDDRYRACFVAGVGMVIVTIDCSGQELRILADYSQERVWIEAFLRGEDVHSVCAELLYYEEWKKGSVHEAYEVEVKGKIKIIPRCAYYYADDQGRIKQKCKCPRHEELRARLKAVNFGLAYGKTAWGLAADLEISLADAEQLLADYRNAFPTLCAWLEATGDAAFMALESRTKSQRRRVYEKITSDYAKRIAVERFKEKMKEPAFAAKMREIGKLGPNEDDIRQAYGSLCAGTKREGKNTPIQGTAGDMMKMACGCGFDKTGKPYLWHIIEPQFNAMFVNFVYDEFVYEAPEEHGQAVYDAAEDAIRRAGAHFIKSIPMESEGHVDKRWRK